MFTHFCTACDRKQLIFISQLTSVEAGASGAVATFTCWCGATQTSDFSLLDAALAPASPVVAPTSSVNG